MGYKNPPKGKGFQPGKSGNPQGARLHNPIKKKLKLLTNSEVERLVVLMLTGTCDDLNAISKNPESSIMERWTAEIMKTGIKKGDVGSLESMLNRIVGKPKNVIDIPKKPQGESSTNKLLEMTSAQRVSYFSDMIEKLKNLIKAELDVGGE